MKNLILLLTVFALTACQNSSDEKGAQDNFWGDMNIFSAPDANQKPLQTDEIERFEMSLSYVATFLSDIKFPSPELTEMTKEMSAKMSRTTQIGQQIASHCEIFQDIEKSRNGKKTVTVIWSEDKFEDEKLTPDQQKARKKNPKIEKKKVSKNCPLKLNIEVVETQGTSSALGSTVNTIKNYQATVSARIDAFRVNQLLKKATNNRNNESYLGVEEINFTVARSATTKPTNRNRKDINGYTTNKNDVNGSIRLVGVDESIAFSYGLRSKYDQWLKGQTTKKQGRTYKSFSVRMPENPIVYTNDMHLKADGSTLQIRAINGKLLLEGQGLKAASTANTGNNNGQGQN